MNDTISPTAASQQIDAGACELIDVRTPVEFHSVHAIGARLAPLDKLDPRSLLNDLPADRRERMLLLICKAGKRAAAAAQKFRDAGIANVCVIEGGTDAWTAAGLPVERGQATMSLERQVRIAAGLLVLIGVVLALTVSKWFALFSGLIGAGLVFAGLTDWCGMGLLLAKAPWNNRGASTKQTCCGG
jgi:rhodanese-related sulfurtransferase